MSNNDSIVALLLPRLEEMESKFEKLYKNYEDKAIEKKMDEKLKKNS